MAEETVADGRSEKPVFVLGAGFTRAVLPRSPLLVDDFGTDELRGQFAQIPRALALLRDEIQRSVLPNRINLERLMTRLFDGMPYDTEEERHELALLFNELKRALQRRIENSREDSLPEDLSRVAKCCIDRCVDVVTFNYDEFLDEALFRLNEGTNEPFWSPSIGYGLALRPSRALVASLMGGENRTPAMSLLKLHGSLGWRPVRGSRSPHPVGSILAHQRWRFSGRESQAHLEDWAEPLLESVPFVVPPVLAKGLTSESLLGIVWARALKALREATSVTFVGYSLPVTDLAGRVLFYEGLVSGRDPLPMVHVVDFKDKEDARERIQTRYSLLLGPTNLTFEFGGAAPGSSAVVDRQAAKQSQLRWSARANLPRVRVWDDGSPRPAGAAGARPGFCPAAQVFYQGRLSVVSYRESRPK